MRTAIRIFIISIMLTILFVSSVSADEIKYIDVNGVKLASLSDKKAEGVVVVKGETSKERIKILVVKGNKNTWYDVNVEGGRFEESIWLNKGIGKYTVYVMVNDQGSQYSFGPKVSVENVKEINEYVSPDQYIESDDKAIIEKAKEITAGAKNDFEKANRIYEWVKNYVEYDVDKYSKHLNNDFNNEYGALLALRTKKGVCFDYSTLVAALGRASGLQVKVVKGQGTIDGFSGYHAWNEIYSAEQNRWIKVDATFGDVSNGNWFDNANFDESHIAE